MSYHNIPTSARQSTTNAQGQTAPTGYHYMPDGTLMSDVEHAALYGNGTVISAFDLDTTNVKTAGETRTFTVTGDGIFSLEIKNENNYYYNFVTNKFQASKTRLDNTTVSGTYTNSIKFPVAPTTTDTVNGAVTSGVKVVMDTVVASTMEVGDKVTGNAALAASNVTVAALNPDGDNTSEFSLSEAVAISDGVTLSFIGSDQYDFLLFADQGTKHTQYSEVRFDDGSLDINSTTGSNSLLITKVIYQTLDVELTLSTLSPNAVAVFTDQTPTTKVITTQIGKNVGKIPFSIPVSAGSTHSFKIDRTPTINDIVSFSVRTIGSAPSDISGEDIYPAVSDTDTVDGAIAGGGSVVKVVMDNNVADNLVVGDKITTFTSIGTINGGLSSASKAVILQLVAGKMAVGDRVTMTSGDIAHFKYFEANVVVVAALNPDGDNAFEFSMALDTPSGSAASIDAEDAGTLVFTPKCNSSVTTVVALNPDTDNVKEFSMSQNVGFKDGATLSFSNRMNYSWPLDNVDGLSTGMVPKNTNITSGSVISSYEDVLTTMEGTEEEYKTIIKSVKAVEKLGTKPTLARDTATKLLTTTQTGNVTFNKQQKLVLAGDSIKFYGYGLSAINALTGWNVEFSDIIVTLTKPTAVTTSAVSASTSVPIDDGDGIMDDISTVSSINMDSTVVDPTVTTIGSYSGSTATLTLSAAQTLEDGETLTFDGAGRTITISGNIEVKKVGGAATTLYFDLEKFITATDES